MAKKIVEHTQSTENIHQSALGLIAELDEHVEKIYAVASGGRSLARHADACTESHLFDVITDMTSSTDLSNMLRDRINELAALAGSKLATESGR